jgi:hypothetical protein
MNVFQKKVSGDVSMHDWSKRIHLKGHMHSAEITVTGRIEATNKQRVTKFTSSVRKRGKPFVCAYIDLSATRLQRDMFSSKEATCGSRIELKGGNKENRVPENKICLEQVCVNVPLAVAE